MTDSPLDGLLVVPRPIRGWRLFAVVDRTFTGLWHRGPEAAFAPDDRDWHRAACRKSDYTATYWSYWGMAPWPRPEPAPTHAVPNRDCQCGFWAVARRELLVKVLGESWQPGGSTGNAQVVAIVELAGRVVVHTEAGKTTGWRGEQLRIVAWWPLWPWLRRVGRCVPGLSAWAERLLGAGPDCAHCGAPGCAAHPSSDPCRACQRPTAEPGCWHSLWRSSDARRQA